MADSYVSPVLQIVLDKLTSPIFEKIGDMWNLGDNIQKLQRTLPMVQALLEDLQQQQVSNKFLRLWILNLENVAYTAKGVLDGATSPGRSVSLLYFSNMRHARLVRGVLSELQSTIDEGIQLSNLGKQSMSRVSLDSCIRETSCYVDESDIFGREEDKEKIIDKLLCCEVVQGGKASCISIAGMGGMGKTTLAQLVFNDQRVTKHFDVKVWIYVSDQFDAKNVMMEIIKSLNKDKCSSLTMNDLHSSLRDLLHNKRYLIVLDDVWIEHHEEWDKLKPIFRGSVDGSKIIITTRNEKVAALMNSRGPPYYLRGLDEDSSWCLFKQHAFQQGEEEEHLSLLPIGKQIVQKCGGVPLAAKTLGSLMRFKRKENEWLSVQNSEIWELDESESGNLLQALRLSYHHLPQHLKRCFAFCSIFPRDYVFRKEKLIRLWMAEDLIEYNTGRKTPEDSGNDYFNDLLWISFFEEVKESNHGGCVRYKMHDVIYDLAKSVAGPEYSVLYPASLSTNFAEICYASVVCDFKSSMIPEEIYAAKRLRTLVLLSEGNFYKAIPKLCSNFSRSLHVLDLSGSALSILHESIGELSELRYLDLSHTHLCLLPRSIEKLTNLQTLILFGCYNLVTLHDLTKMKSPRHLDTTGCKALTKMLPEYVSNQMLGFGKELQTLPLFVVGRLQDIKFLQELYLLRRSLKITQLKNIHNSAGEICSLMGYKGYLESLGLYWGNDDGCPNIDPEEEYVVSRFQERKKTHICQPSSVADLDDSKLGEMVLHCLNPPENLRRLLIKEYPGSKFPHWRLPFLNLVRLIDCRGSKQLPNFGNLQYLTVLSLEGMHGVERISKELYGEGTIRSFSALRELVLVDFPNLKEWPSPNGGNAFPNLTKLIVSKCPQLKKMPFIPSLQHLEIRNCCEVLLLSFQNITSLKTLVIEKIMDLLSFSSTSLLNNPLLTSLDIISCPELRLLPSKLGSLTTLRSLSIRWCEKLICLPQGVQKLSALESMEIGDCHCLSKLLVDGTEGLSSLRTLSIENCSNLSSLSIGLQYLTSLENLTIMYCPKLDDLPHSVQHLSSLRRLTIISCPALASLPEGLQNLTVLHCLEIRSCPRLTELPRWIHKLVSLRSLAISDCPGITFLPQGLKNLTELQHLSFQDCHELEDRCEPTSGVDWPKISHVPFIQIGSSVQSNTNKTSDSSE